MTDQQKLTQCRKRLPEFPIQLRVIFYKGLAIDKEMFDTGFINVD